MALTKHGVIYRKNDGLTRIAPLAKWQENDIETYTFLNKLPVLDSYLQDGFGERTSASVPPDFYGIRSAALAKLRHRNPAKFNELRNKFPEIAQYV